jgi:hypothetical protein
MPLSRAIQQLKISLRTSNHQLTTSFSFSATITRQSVLIIIALLELEMRQDGIVKRLGET